MLVVGDGQYLAVLESRQDNHGLHAVNFFNVAYPFQHEFLVRRDVFGDDFQQKVAAAGYVVAFNDLVDLVDFADKSIDIRLLVADQGDLHEGSDAEADFLSVQLGVVAADQTTVFQFLYAFQRRGGRQTNFFRQVGVGNFCVILQDFQNLAVNIIKFDDSVCTDGMIILLCVKL